MAMTKQGSVDVFRDMLGRSMSTDELNPKKSSKTAKQSAKTSVNSIRSQNGSLGETSGLGPRRGSVDSIVSAASTSRPIPAPGQGVVHKDPEVRNEWDPFFISDKDEENLFSFEKCFEGSKRVIKSIVAIFVFIVVLGCVLVNKATVLYTVSQLNVQYDFATDVSTANNTCGYPVFLNQTPRMYLGCNVTATPGEMTAAAWVWSTLLIQCSPYILMLFRCLWKIGFKTKKSPSGAVVAFTLVVETLHIFGVCMLLYIVLPTLSALSGLFLMTAVALVPAFLNTMRHIQELRDDDGHCRITPGAMGVISVDVVVILIQAIGAFPWLIANDRRTQDEQECQYGDLCIGQYDVSIILAPISVILISFTWWSNFVGSRRNLSDDGCSFLLNIRFGMQGAKTKLFAIVSLYRLILTLILVFSYYTWGTNVPIFCSNIFHENFRTGGDIESNWWIVAVVNICVSAVGFYFSDFAIKARLQITDYTIPLVLATPLSLAVLAVVCFECESFIIGSTTEYISCFLNERPDSEYNYFMEEIIYLGFFWWLSQLWISSYLWKPSAPRMAKTNKLFEQPFYCGALYEQSLTYIRHRDDGLLSSSDAKTMSHHNSDRQDVIFRDEPDTVSERGEMGATVCDQPYERLFSAPKSMDHVPYIYFCATLWHETEEEMCKLLTSIYRCDIDQGARREAMESFNGFEDPDYYNFEAHIFFDDAFEYHEPEVKKGFKVNSFVKMFLRSINMAASSYFNVPFDMGKPKLLLTPYGGRLEYQLVFDNKLIVHLKDKVLIRHRKRWSQVMYLHYLLGDNLYNAPTDLASGKRKERKSENTYLLALDGDIDFKPKALALLVDLLKRNPSVAAACGRIHPTGSGPIVWYQKFEYSLGHWLQKATEHILGCVLCSPGCFSMFRASALMEDNIIAMYRKEATKPPEYVQFDQGEDRWLCTLLLQRGHRVEYSAAADAYTNAPEGFGEFFNQRRRWITSTFANQMDLMSTARVTARDNDNISMLYMIYQGILFGSSIIGPGTIFLLIIGALQVTLRFPPLFTFTLIFAPLLGFMWVCYKRDNKKQIRYAAVLSIVLGVNQMLVLVGIALQFSKSGVCSPTSFLTLFVIGVFILGGIIHPQEFWNIVYFPIYYLAIPCVYMVLIIFALCNTNNVSWGTREVKTATPAETPQVQKQDSKKKPPSKQEKLLRALGIDHSQDSTEGTHSYSWGTCCRMVCCVNPSSDPTSRILSELGTIKQELQDLKHPKPDYEQREEQRSKTVTLPSIHEDEDFQVSGRSHRRTVKSDPKSLSPSDSDPILIKPKSTWTDDDEFSEMDCGQLKPTEKKFWKDLIKKYLEPILPNPEKEKKDREAMAKLRDKVVFSFFIVNIMLVVLFLGLQIVNKVDPDADLSVKWNCTVNGEVFESEIQPIGFLFIILYGFIIGIQVIGMILHQIFTFLHLISATSILPSSSNRDEFDMIEGIKTLMKIEPEPDLVSIVSEYSSNDTISSKDSGYLENITENIQRDRPKRMGAKRTRTKTEPSVVNKDTMRKRFAARFLALQEEINDQSGGVSREPTVNFSNITGSVNRNRMNRLRREYNIDESDIARQRPTVKAAFRDRKISKQHNSVESPRHPRREPPQVPQAPRFRHSPTGTLSHTPTAPMVVPTVTFSDEMRQPPNDAKKGTPPPPLPRKNKDRRQGHANLGLELSPEEMADRAGISTPDKVEDKL